ncbi:hypothetical protein H2200_010139 [Cladophialophora chaetospira]|uniref:Uncharacterized protein n=1 Tax=Cladophialophora chaetospira TaxID=386627 RepID=A0AA39CES0_9EURO|nr:hypothetical protein H2200_010139 [Cladophialophora chaetospira]
MGKVKKTKGEGKKGKGKGARYDGKWDKNPTCQIIDWQRHMQTCKRLNDEKSLYQAGDLLRRLWLTLRASAFVSNLDAVDVQRDGRIQVFEQRVQNRYPDPFRHEIFRDDGVKEAILCDRASGDAIEHMRSITSLVLQQTGLVSDLKEIKVLVHPGYYEVTSLFRDAQNPDYTPLSPMYPRQSTRKALNDKNNKLEQRLLEHRLFVACLNSDDEVFAVDLSGAHFEIYDSVLPWNTYAAMRNIHEEDVTAYVFGTHDEKEYMRCDEDGIRYYQLMAFNARRTEYLLQAWLQRDGYSVAKFISLKSSIFEDKLADLEKYVTRGLDQTQYLAMNCGELMVDWYLATDEELKASLLHGRAQILQQADAQLP